MTIKCRQCGGSYQLRDGRYGVFAGCSNYPRCRSTLKLYELAAEFIRQRGINVYCWERCCWKCGKSTPVYSYYLSYELEELDEYFGSFPPVGLGDLTWVDQLLAREIPTIQMRYSHTVNASYMANTCVHCGALQGHNYVVEDPHEIIGPLWLDRAMGQYLYKTVYLDNPDPLLPELKAFYSTGV